MKKHLNLFYILVLTFLSSAWSTMTAQNQFKLEVLDFPDAINLGCELPIRCTFVNEGAEAFVAEDWQLNVNVSDEGTVVEDVSSLPIELSISMPPVFLSAGDSVTFQRNIPVQWGLFEAPENDEPTLSKKNIVIVWGGEAIDQQEEQSFGVKEISVSLDQSANAANEIELEPTDIQTLGQEEIPTEVLLWMDIIGEIPDEVTFYGLWNQPIYLISTENGGIFSLNLNTDQLGFIEEDVPEPLLIFLLTQLPNEELDFIIPEGSLFGETIAVMESGLVVYLFEDLILNEEEWIEFVYQNQIPIEILEMIANEFPGGDFIDFVGLGMGSFGYSISLVDGTNLFMDDQNQIIYSYNPENNYYDPYQIENPPVEFQESLDAFLAESTNAEWFFHNGFQCEGFYSANTPEGLVFNFSSDGNIITESTAIENHLLEEINIYPNPTNGLIFIDSPEPLIAIKVHSSNGALVLSQKNYRGKQINLSHLPKGLYQVQLLPQNGQLKQQSILLK